MLLRLWSKCKAPKPANYKKNQFDQLFVQQISNKCQNNVRNHSCTYDVDQNIKVSDLDITLCITIIMNCYEGSLTPQEDTNLRNIRQIRNEIAHYQNNVDLTQNEFYRMCGTVANATISLARDISQEYCNEIQDRIKRLKERKILAAAEEYMECLHHILQWNMQAENNVVVIQDRMERFEQNVGGQIDKLGKQMEDFYCSRYKQRRFIDELPQKIVLVIQRKCQSLQFELGYVQSEEKTALLEGKDGDDSKSVYLETFNKIEKLRRDGRKYKRSALNYCVLVYTILRGSASADEIRFDVLEQIDKALYNMSTLAKDTLLIKNF
ncbi:unnamed protein product [Mytilus edulis]|uniref:DZIP3-like HEPN domain-containing protein n=1 Tax=Mytilus edulis TaxID=6550 RepID=A0A8S3RTS6_MYTED|nr:unnamed protein product [Mytilus edulis]